MAEHRRERLHQRISSQRLPGPVIAMIFVAVAATGYVLGTYNTQIIGAIAPVFGVKTYGGSLDLSTVQETYRALKANYDGVLDDKSLIEGANRGLVEAAGDEYTTYFNATDAADFDDQLTGNVGTGIGIEVGLRNDLVTVLRILKDNPAEKAGMLAGDVIVGVNDESADGWTVDETVSRIRGESGTTVKVTVSRDGDTIDFTLTRATINNPSVYTSIEGTVGIMTITRFDDETGELARAAARQFTTSGVTSVILDLRGNGGGYLTAAQSVAGLWLDGKVVVTERANGKVEDELTSGTDPILEGVPTVVLVNSSSASASEIVAGALQDYGVATLLGEKTFGKGSVQKLIALPEGAELKVTVARWYTPKGNNISDQGITPDQVVERTADDIKAGNDPQLQAAKDYLQ